MKSYNDEKFPTNTQIEIMNLEFEKQKNEKMSAENNSCLENKNRTNININTNFPNDSPLANSQSQKPD